MATIAEVRQSIKSLTETQEKGKREVDQEFRKVAKNLDRLTENIDKLTQSQDKLAKFQDKLAKSQDKLAKSQDKLTQSQDKLTKSQDKLTQSQDKLTQSQDKLTQSQDKLTKFQDKLAKFQDKLAKSQDKLTQSQDKLTQSQDKLTKTQDKLTATQNRLAKDQERGFKQLRDRVNQSVGGWDNRWGKFIETLVSTGTSRLLRLRGIKIDKVIQRVKDHINPQPRWEIDVLAKNSTLMIAIETKHYLTKEDVDEAIEKFKRFKKDYQDCSGKILYGAVGYLDCETKINQYAERKGLFVFQATGDSAVLINEVDFQPEAL